MEHKKQRIIQIVAISLTAVVIAVAVGLVFMFTKKEETPLNGYSREDTIQDITVYQTLYGKNTETAATDAANAMNELSQLIGFEEDDSDIQKLNQAAGLDWISLDSRTISILDKAEKDVRARNESNNSSVVYYIDSENRLANIDIDEVEPLELISLLKNPDVEKMLKEEILKKMLDGYYSKLPRHIIKDIINSYQEKNIQ